MEEVPEDEIVHEMEYAGRPADLAEAIRRVKERRERRQSIRRPLDRAELVKQDIMARAFRQWQFHFNTGFYADGRGPFAQHPWMTSLMGIVATEYEEAQEWKRTSGA